MTNLVECMNSVFTGVRYLLVMGLVKTTFYKLSSYFDKHLMTTVAQKQASERIS